MNNADAAMALDMPMPGMIRPERLASKLAGVRREKYLGLADEMMEEPRFLEALWFVQFMSMQPGGVAKFAEELAAFIAPRVGTASMQQFGLRAYTLTECEKVWHEIPPTGAMIRIESLMRPTAPLWTSPAST